MQLDVCVSCRGSCGQAFAATRSTSAAGHWVWRCRRAPGERAEVPLCAEPRFPDSSPAAGLTVGRAASAGARGCTAGCCPAHCHRPPRSAGRPPSRTWPAIRPEGLASGRAASTHGRRIVDNRDVERLEPVQGVVHRCPPMTKSLPSSTADAAPGRGGPSEALGPSTGSWRDRRRRTWHLACKAIPPSRKASHR